MRLKVLIDTVGWYPTSNTPGAAVWQSVTCDEMKVGALELRGTFPELSDVDAVRRFFRDLVALRKGALISCDPVANTETPMVRIVSKYPAGRAQAVTFVASVAVPLPGLLVELLITASEDNFTGVREALLLKKLLETAGPSEHRQFSNKVIPIEWKFERYEPGTRRDWAYFVGDDEKYDAAFPNHPLTRVRRWLRRNERSFRVIVVEPAVKPVPPTEGGSGKGGLFGKLRDRLARQEITTLDLKPAHELQRHEIEVGLVPVKLMGWDEIVRELGPQIASDAMTQEAFKKLAQEEKHRDLGFPSLEVRQKMYRDQRDEELKRIFDQQHQAEARIKSIREAGEKLLSESTVDDAKLIAARNRDTGGWHIAQEGALRPIALFTGSAFFEDYMACKGLACDPVVMTIKGMFARLPELTALGVDSLSLDRCPRCPDVRQVYRFAAMRDEAALLQVYACHIAAEKFLVEEKFQQALQETDTGRRLAAFNHIIEHMDPGNESVRMEIGKLAGG